MKKIITFFLILFILLPLNACSKKQEDDIYIVFTNDVHCAEEDNIGYAGVAAFTKELKKEHKYVSLVDVGDFSSGSAVGSLSVGYYPTMFMNAVGYDVATLGNHEFDYNIDNLLEYVLGCAEFDIVACNLGYTGKNENLLKDIKPYVVKEYGNTKVAYVGVVTPSTLTESTPTVFMEDGEFVYDFYFGDVKENFYTNLQSVIDKAHKEADYVILLAHCGTNEMHAPYRSIDIAENTYNVDVIIDGHSHSEILGDTYTNTKGKEVPIWQTGTQLNNIGQLVLTKEHTVEGILISEYEKKDEATQDEISALKAALTNSLQTVTGTTAFDLTISEKRNDIDFRIVRSRETNLGDLCADAFRYVYNCDIAVVNGGGVRANIPAGEITMDDILTVSPFQNTTAMVEVDGQTILDMLEYSVYSALPYTDNGEEPVGEFGGFLQVSGLKFTVNASIDSPVIIEEEMYKGIDGERRVKDVFVEKDGNYEPLDPSKQYTLASTQYILYDLGNGYTMFDKAKAISKEGVVDASCIIEYIGVGLNGVIPSEYEKPQGRIIFE